MRRSGERRVPLLAGVLGLALLLGGAGVAAKKGGWEYVLHDAGIVVHQKQQPGRDFPTFRGVGVVEENIFQVLAVLRDVGRHGQWMERSKNTHMIRKTDEFHYTVYGRTDAPWPVSDRDAVFRSSAKVEYDKKRVTVRFWAVRSKLKPPVSGVVRMTRLRGFFRFQAIAEGRTRVTYQVDADPQGSLPGWIARAATKTLPLKTLKGLRRQARKTRGWYDKQIAQWKKLYEAQSGGGINRNRAGP